MKLMDVKRSARTSSRIGIILGIIVTLVISNVLFTMITGEHFRSGENILSMKSGSGYTTQKIIAERGHIYDRSGEAIAQDIESYDLFAYIDENRVNASDEPVYVSDFDKTSKELAPILEKDPTKVAAVTTTLKDILSGAKTSGSTQTEFGSYGKNLSAADKLAIDNLKLPGLDFTKSISRTYPAGMFASQLIGYTTYDKNNDLVGKTGLEAYFDKELKGSNGEVVYQTDSSQNKLPNNQKNIKIPKNGDDVYLTLDKDTQLALEKALTDTMKTNSAQYAWGIVMEAKTGRILAQAGYPSYDLNTREGVDENAYNIPSQRPFEPGSIMKVFTYAAAMNEGVYDGNAMFRSKDAYIYYDENNKPFRSDTIIPGAKLVTTISDAQGRDNGIVSYDTGFIRSLNTGITSLLTHYLDVDTNVEYFRKFKLFDPVDIYGVDEIAGTLNTPEYNPDNPAASPLDKMVLGYGQSSRNNSYEIMQAATAIFGDGTLIKPYIVDKIVDPNTGETTYQGKSEKLGNPITPETAKKMQALMRQVVEDPKGTAHPYQMEDVTMMAKTGTGQLTIPGEVGYSEDIYTSSILAAAPAENPEIIVYYAFEGSDIINYNRDYFKDIVRESLASLNKYNNTASTIEIDPNSIDETTGTTQYTMPALVNHSLDYVKQKLNGYDLKVHFIGDGSNVISQFPLENGKLLSKQNIFLLTDGTNIAMPNMSEWSRKDVATFAQFVGLKVTYKGSGRVVKQSLNENTPIKKGDQLLVELE